MKFIFDYFSKVNYIKKQKKLFNCKIYRNLMLRNCFDMYNQDYDYESHISGVSIASYNKKTNIIETISINPIEYLGLEDGEKVFNMIINVYTPNDKINFCIYIEHRNDNHRYYINDKETKTSIDIPEKYSDLDFSTEILIWNNFKITISEFYKTGKLLPNTIKCIERFKIFSRFNGFHFNLIYVNEINKFIIDTIEKTSTDLIKQI